MCEMTFHHFEHCNGKRLVKFKSCKTGYRRWCVGEKKTVVEIEGKGCGRCAKCFPEGYALNEASAEGVDKHCIPVQQTNFEGDAKGGEP